MTRRRTVILIVLLGLAVLGLGGWFGLQRYVEGRVRAALDDLRPGLDVTYAGLALHPLERSLSLDGVTARTADGMVLKADQTVFYSCDTAHQTPYFLRCALRGARVEAGDWAGPAGSLLRTGTDLDLDYFYDPLGRALTVRSLRLVQKDAFETELSGQFGNVDLDRFSDGLYFVASLARLEAVYRDRSLARRVLEAFAAQFHADPARIRENLSAWARGQAAQAAGRGRASTANSLEALAAFLKEPGELTVHLAPAEPVPMLYLFAEGNLIQALDLLNARIEAR